MTFIDPSRRGFAAGEPFARSLGPAEGDDAGAILAGLLDALASLDVGIALCDGGARLLCASAPALAIVRAGGPLRVRAGVLRAASAEDASALAAAIAAAARGGRAAAPAALRLESGEGPPLLVQVAGVEAGGVPDGVGALRPRAALFLRDPGRVARPSAEALKARFALTPAEAAVAREIAQGRGAGACAARLGISRATVRTHLKHVFEKTGARRQAELVRILAAAAAPLVLDEDRPAWPERWGAVKPC